ncbi:MAG: D-Ala-D-Ala carboxypeptidase family metallohydrolase [Candidatus Azobacteroides sp.]|nr:D-Ala-D-Ala carboxypeptidase family metallohydrolase [Candidatus Azobacteroides sp.]
MENISMFISYAEAVKSNTAVRYARDNTPDAEQLENMKYVASKVFDKLRAHFGKPIAVTSFFRSRSVNALVGGSLTSQHCKGEAIDIDGDILGGVSNADIFNYIKNNLVFDQLIWEFGNDKNPDWVHVSLKRIGNNRKQILRSVKKETKTEYKVWN